MPTDIAKLTEEAEIAQAKIMKSFSLSTNKAVALQRYG